MKINGPIEVVYVVTALFTVMTILLLAGKGSWLIAGYNTASEAERAKYDAKKLSRVVGGCTGIVTILLLITSLAWRRLPQAYVYIMLAVIVVDIAVTIFLANTICRKGEVS